MIKKTMKLFAIMVCLLVYTGCEDDSDEAAFAPDYPITFDDAYSKGEVELTVLDANQFSLNVSTNASIPSLRAVRFKNGDKWGVKDLGEVTLSGGKGVFNKSLVDIGVYEAGKDVVICFYDSRTITIDGDKISWDPDMDISAAERRTFKYKIKSAFSSETLDDKGKTKGLAKGKYEGNMNDVWKVKVSPKFSPTIATYKLYKKVNNGTFTEIAGTFTPSETVLKDMASSYIAGDKVTYKAEVIVDATIKESKEVTVTVGDSLYVDKVENVKLDAAFSAAKAADREAFDLLGNTRDTITDLVAAADIVFDNTSAATKLGFASTANAKFVKIGSDSLYVSGNMIEVENEFAAGTSVTSVPEVKAGEYYIFKTHRDDPSAPSYGVIKIEEVYSTWPVDPEKSFIKFSYRY